MAQQGVLIALGVSRLCVGTGNINSGIQNRVECKGWTKISTLPRVTFSVLNTHDV